MSKIKLLKIDELSDKTQRFQSQLSLGTDAADFVMDVDGVMKIWNGGNFIPYEGEFEIVSNKSEMSKQPL